MNYDQDVYDALDARTEARGQLRIPSLPAACEHYLERLSGLFRQLGKQLSDVELMQLREVLVQRANEGWQQSTGSKLSIQYEITVTSRLSKNLACNVSVVTPSLNEQYDGWLQDSSETPFGAHPDAMVVSTTRRIEADQNDQQHQINVLDIGAGNGRNAVALAKMGCRVDAVEMNAEMSARLKAHARQGEVTVNVTTADFTSPNSPAIPGKYQFAFASEVVTHFRDANQLARFAKNACDVLEPGGVLVFNMFLPKGDFQPNELALQATRLAWASLFSRDDLESAVVGLPMTLVTEEPALENERSNLPEDSCPPTPWFESWASGRAAFPSAANPPVELRWLEFQRHQT